MKKLALLSLLVLSACASQPCQHHHRVVAKDNDQVKYAQRYMNFLTQFGAAQSQDEAAIIPHPFDKNCQKMLNNNIVAKSSDQFISQLTEVKKIAPIWKFSNVQIHPHLRENAATVSYDVSAAGLGEFTVIKVINFSENGGVINVLEVYAESSKTN